MKYEDLVWESVEGTDYWETTIETFFNETDKAEIKVRKLDDDSFIIFVNDKQVSESGLDYLKAIYENDKMYKFLDKEKPDLSLNDFNKDPIGNDIATLEQHVKKWESIVWKQHPEYGTFFEMKHATNGGMYQVIKLDEDSYKSRTLSDHTVNWSEINKEQLLLNFATAYGVRDPYAFTTYYLEQSKAKTKEANTFDTDHTEV